MGEDFVTILKTGDYILDNLGYNSLLFPINQWIGGWGRDAWKASSLKKVHYCDFSKISRGFLVHSARNKLF